MGQDHWKGLLGPNWNTNWNTNWNANWPSKGSFLFVFRAGGLPEAHRWVQGRPGEVLEGLIRLLRALEGPLRPLKALKSVSSEFKGLLLRTVARTWTSWNYKKPCFTQSLELPEVSTSNVAPSLSAWVLSQDEHRMFSGGNDDVTHGFVSIFLGPGVDSQGPKRALITPYKVLTLLYFTLL